MEQRRIFLTGATGYLGSRLIPLLRARGHVVRALIRPESASKLSREIETVVGNPLDASTFSNQVLGMDTVVQLVGVPKPAPWKGDQFRRVDGPSALASIAAAKGAKTTHFVYVSVAHPARVMRTYIAVRQEGERLVRDTGLAATMLRPWYVLGPGHWWPYALVPVYALLRAWPATREGATRLGLVTHAQMVAALVHAVEHPPSGVRVVDVPAIRRGGR